MKRWPRVSSPDAMPPTEKRTTSGSSVSAPKVHRIDCSGRTQRSVSGSDEVTPQRMLLGQGKPRISPGIRAATTSEVGCPALWMWAT